MDGNQLDSAVTWLLYGAMAGSAVALLLYIISAAGRRSARPAGILAALCALVYIGAGITGAAIRVETGEAPAGADPAPSSVTGRPGADATDADEAVAEPAVEDAAATLSRAVVEADWPAATAAHEALRALDPTHPGLAPALVKIVEGRAKTAAESHAEGDATGDVELTGSEPPAAVEPDSAVERRTRTRAKKRTRRRRRRSRAPEVPPGEGGEGGEAPFGDEPDVPTTLEPEPEPEPEPTPESPPSDGPEPG